MRTWFHSGHSRTWALQYPEASAVSGASPASTSLRGTFAATVTPNPPNRHSALPAGRPTAPSSGHLTDVTTAIAAHSSAEPRNTSMKGARTAAALTDRIAATPRAGGNVASPLITNVEKAQKTPATSPVPSTPSTVSTKDGPSITSSAPARPAAGIPSRRPPSPSPQ